MQIVEENGVRYQLGLPPVDEIEGEMRDPNAPRDPEAWRKYSDVIDAEQIAWLKAHPKEAAEGYGLPPGLER